MKNQIYYGDNLPILQSMDAESIDLIYIDPPFNTGKVQKQTRIQVERSEEGDRTGFNGKKYKSTIVGTKAYSDEFSGQDEYLAHFLGPRLHEAHRILADHGLLYFHIDHREGHYCKVLLDIVFGRECLINEIIWAYDFGGKPKTRWAPKHDYIFVYAKNPENYTFNAEAADKIEYVAPGPKGRMTVGPTDVWWHTIVPTNSKERTGYPTQKPEGILNRIIEVSSNSGDMVLDFFAGSGTTGKCCYDLDRRFTLIDNNEEALEVMAKRFDGYSDIEWIGFDPSPFQSKS